MDSSTSRELSSPGDGFAQQGSLDWVALSKSSVSFTIGVLGRLAAANVNPLTVAIGQAIGRNFRLSETGRRNVQDALGALRSYRSLGDGLWFGFGIKTLVRDLGTTNEGMSLLSLCAALVEAWDDEKAAEVMYHLTSLAKAPESLTPSQMEWLRFVRACSGTLSSTSFSIKVEGFMRLLGRPFDMSMKDNVRAWPRTSDIAKVLHLISHLREGVNESLEIQGRGGAAIIAAMSAVSKSSSMMSEGLASYSED